MYVIVSENRNGREFTCYNMNTKDKKLVLAHVKFLEKQKIHSRAFVMTLKQAQSLVSNMKRKIATAMEIQRMGLR